MVQSEATVSRDEADADAEAGKLRIKVAAVGDNLL